MSRKNEQDVYPSPVSGGQDKPNPIQPLLSQTNYEITGQLMGRLLTLIDATIPESKQTEALKDLIRQEIYQADTEVWRHINAFGRDHDITPVVLSTKPE